MPRKALFLVNPAAGKRQSREPLFDAAAVLSQAGYLLNIHLTSGRGDATETARREGADYDLVLCSGGDGTLNETITGLMALPSPPPLGYLPRGSTNDFAASLGIPVQPREAAEAIVRSQGQGSRHRTLERPLLCLRRLLRGLHPQLLLRPPGGQEHPGPLRLHPGGRQGPQLPAPLPGPPDGGRRGPGRGLPLRRRLQLHVSRRPHETGTGRSHHGRRQV